MASPLFSLSVVVPAYNEAQRIASTLAALTAFLRAQPWDWEIRVVDDGRGPGPNAGRGREGHLGLRLLRDSMDDLGGSMEISPGPGGGTALTVRFPAAFDRP